MKKYIKIEALTREQSKWYTGKELDGVVKFYVTDPARPAFNAGFFPTELFCKVKKNGFYDIEAANREYGMLRGFCGSQGRLFDGTKTELVKEVLKGNGYEIIEEGQP